MTSERGASAEMPGGEQIRDIIQTVVNQCTSEPTEWSDCVDDATAAILDLFASILAEKEREIDRLKRIERNAWNEIELQKSRALAAEAARAAERERTTVAMTRLKEYASDPDIALTLQGSPDKCQALQDAIAATIQAQGET